MLAWKLVATSEDGLIWSKFFFSSCFFREARSRSSENGVIQRCPVCEFDAFICAVDDRINLQSRQVVMTERHDLVMRVAWSDALISLQQSS